MDRGRGRRIATATALPPEAIELALAVGLPPLAAQARRREVLVETIDGEAAARSSWRSALADARVDYRALVVPAAQLAHG